MYPKMTSFLVAPLSGVYDVDLGGTAGCAGCIDCWVKGTPQLGQNEASSSTCFPHFGQKDI